MPSEKRDKIEILIKKAKNMLKHFPSKKNNSFYIFLDFVNSAIEYFLFGKKITEKQIPLIPDNKMKYKKLIDLYYYLKGLLNTECKFYDDYIVVKNWKHEQKISYTQLHSYLEFIKKVIL